MEKCKYKPIERAGLYIMVFIAMMNTCSIDTTVDTIKDKVTIIEEYVANQSLNSDGGAAR